MAYKILKSASGVTDSAEKCEVMVESSSDLSSLPDNLAIGSTAYLADLSAIWIKGLDGTWTRVGGGGD